MKKQENYFEGMLDNQYLKYLNQQAKSNQATTSMQNQQLGISQKYDRNLYEDKTKMYKYRESLYQDKKTIKDPITGKSLHIDQQAAKNKYKDNYREHIPQIDHVMSLSDTHSHLKKNPYLSEKDLKEILNKEYNLSVVNAEFNNMKSDQSPFKVLLDTNNGLTLDERMKFAGITAEATMGVATNTAARTAKNMTLEFADGAMNSVYQARTALIIQGIYNLQQVYTNEKTMDEAIADMGALSAVTVAVGGTKKVIETGLQNVLNTSKNSLLKAKNISMGKIGQIIQLCEMVGTSAVKLINGEIDGKEFFIEIGEKGVESIGAVVGAIAGELLIPIPFVGSIIGSIVVSNVCSFVYRNFVQIGSMIMNKLADFKQMYEEYKDIGMLKKKLEEISAIANEALIEMDRQRSVLKENIDKHFKNWDSKVNTGLDIIFTCTMQNDVEGIAKGLDKILEIFDGQVKFRSYEEFDEFFMDDNSILEL